MSFLFWYMNSEVVNSFFAFLFGKIGCENFLIDNAFV